MCVPMARRETVDLLSEFESARTARPSSIRFTVTLTEPGTYDIEFDLVHETLTWFKRAAGGRDQRMRYGRWTQTSAAFASFGCLSMPVSSSCLFSPYSQHVERVAVVRMLDLRRDRARHHARAAAAEAGRHRDVLLAVRR